MKEELSRIAVQLVKIFWEVEAFPLAGWKGDDGLEEQTTRYSLLNCLIYEFDNEV